MIDYLKVLVVHRQRSVAGDIKRLFDSAGWSVHLAHNGLDGLQAARREGYRMIVASIDLPVITGIEMIRGVRNFSLNVDTPVYFIDTRRDSGYHSIINKLNASIQAFDDQEIDQLVANLLR